MRYDTVSSLKLLLGALSITRKSCSKLTSARFTSALVNLFHNTPPANALLREARYHQPSGFLFPLMTMLYSPPPTTLLSPYIGSCDSLWGSNIFDDQIFYSSACRAFLHISNRYSKRISFLSVSNVQQVFYVYYISICICVCVCMFMYRVFIKYCVFSLKFFEFSELCQLCCSAGFLPACCVYTHWHREKTESGKYIKIFEKTQYLMNTL